MMMMMMMMMVGGIVNLFERSSIEFLIVDRKKTSAVKGVDCKEML